MSCVFKETQLSEKIDLHFNRSILSSVQPGIHFLYPKISCTKKKGFSRFNLAASWKRKYRGQQEDEPWYLLTNLPDLKGAMAYRPASYGVYSQRYGIEAMFKDCKTGGYNLEGCQASPEKLIALIILIAMAMTAAWLRGKRTRVHLTLANTSN